MDHFDDHLHSGGEVNDFKPDADSQEHNQAPTLGLVGTITKTLFLRSGCIGIIQLYLSNPPC
jgi:hypothetical protein